MPPVSDYELGNDGGAGEERGGEWGGEGGGGGGRIPIGEKAEQNEEETMRSIVGEEEGEKEEKEGVEGRRKKSVQVCLVYVHF